MKEASDESGIASWRHILALVVLAVVLPLAVLGVPEAAHGVPANSVIEPLTQPDGTVIWARQFGDEWANGHQTQDGYTILLDEASGFWVYAEPVIGGGLQASPWIVGHDLPLGIPKRLPLPAAPAALTQGASQSAAVPEGSPNTVEGTSNLGSQRVLVIFADFTPSARAGATGPSLSSEFFGPAASVKDYYEEVSTVTERENA
jgi:hypothetical protein